MERARPLIRLYPLAAPVPLVGSAASAGGARLAPCSSAPSRERSASRSLGTRSCERAKRRAMPLPLRSGLVLTSGAAASTNASGANFVPGANAAFGDDGKVVKIL